MTLNLKPNPKQVEFFLAKARFVGYGGARGGGKSWAIRQKAKLLALNYPGIRMLILRRSFPELRENHILPLKQDLKDVARYKDSEKAFSFPNGSRLIFGYCADEHDVDQYQGQEYDVIFIDEATHFTEYQYSTLTACLRGANPFPKRMYLTCNPGGVATPRVACLPYRPTLRTCTAVSGWVSLRGGVKWPTSTQVTEPA